MNLRAPVLALLIVSTSGFSSIAHANNAATAQALFEQGRALMASGKYDAACPKFEGSQKLDPGPGTEFNLALCYERSGKTASAWAAYLSAAAAYKATHRPDWELKARERAQALASTLAKLTIVAPSNAPPNLRVTRDGVDVTASELGSPIPIDPGTHSIEAAASGGTRFRASIDVAPGKAERVEIVLGDSAASSAGGVGGAARGANGATNTAESADGSSSQRTLAFVVGGVGVAGVATGAITGLVAMSENSASKRDCPDSGLCASRSAIDANESARTWATVSTVGFIAGGALLATGIVLFATAPHPARAPASAHPRAVVVPRVGLGALGLEGAW